MTRENINRILIDPGNSAEQWQTLARTRTFKGVSEATLRALTSHSIERQLKAEEILFRPGTPYKQKVYVVLHGDLTMYRKNGALDPVEQGDFIGLANYLDNHDHTSMAIATSPATLLEIESQTLTDMEQSHPDMFNALNRVIAAKLRQRSPDRAIASGALAQPVSRIMRTPVAGCSPGTTLKEAVETMQSQKIGSLLIVDESEKLLGVLTFAGLAEAATIKGGRPDDSVMKVAGETPYTTDPDTPLWEVEALLKRHHLKYLIVTEHGKAVGTVSKSDILRALISRPGTLENQIKTAPTLDYLKQIYTQLPEIAAEAQETNYRPSAAVRQLSETHLQIQRRVVELTLSDMSNKGEGEPPADFALLIMGSGGRKEMLLNPDQDNGLILDDSIIDTPPALAWFELFSRHLTKNLDQVGYVLCPGDIMASNHQYRKTLSQWKKQISHIVHQPTEKAARWSNILFDFDTLYGNDELTIELRRHTLQALGENARLLKMMADHDAEGRPAIGFFNQLLTTRDDQGEWVDIKRNGLRIIADASRIFALKNGIAMENTCDRLHALRRLGNLSEAFVTSTLEAYQELLDLLLSHQIEQARNSKKPDKLIDPEKLTSQSRGTLRMAMRAVKRFQERLQDDYATDLF
ncbi:MAG: CBS domain-containing protein [Gammaproteobacteria bacterium]|nr:CBS domain-containing protein [Gammaproteobacteria bacterium]